MPTISDDIKLRAIDMHSHFGTKKGYLWRTPEELEHAQVNYKYEVVYRTEEQMAQDLRAAGVKAILDFGFTMTMPIEEVCEYHDYAAQLIKNDPDVYVGIWVALDPRTGRPGLRELERCIRDLKIAVGLTSMSMGMNLPHSDESFYPFYGLCAEANKLVHLMVGYSGYGAGVRGGRGYLIDTCHPRHVDQVAARFPNLNIIAARPAWPWQEEMIAILLHKANVIGYEVHGWSPKHLTQDLKWEIGHRLQDKIMFAADYPIFGYQRLFNDWHNEGYQNEILQKLYLDNAARVLRSVGYDF